MIDLDLAFARMDVSDQAKRVTWTLPPDLPYFDGHFPENPIFPAVGIVDASVFALSRLLERKVALDVIRAAKFSQIIGPDQAVEIAFEQTGDREWTVGWSLAADQGAVATLNLLLRAE